MKFSKTTIFMFFLLGLYTINFIAVLLVDPTTMSVVANGIILAIVTGFTFLSASVDLSVHKSKKLLRGMCADRLNMEVK